MRHVASVDVRRRSVCVCVCVCVNAAVEINVLDYNVAAVAATYVNVRRTAPYVV